ncbi:MAG: hypothetical protein U0T84_02020 [Chitinophagales bacterium]
MNLTLQDLSKDLDTIISVNEDTLKTSSSRVSLEQKYCLGLLSRIVLHGKGLKALFSQIPAIPDLEYSAGLISRAAILDCMLTVKLVSEIYKDENVIALTKEKIELIKIHCETALSDGLKFDLKFVDLVTKFKPELMSDKIKEYQKIRATYGSLLKPASSDEKPAPKHTYVLGPLKLFEHLLKGKNPNWAFLYDPYMFFSKYDHFGLQYFNAVKQPLSFKIPIYIDVVKTLLLHSIFLHDIIALRFKVAFMNDQSEKLQIYLNSLNPPL